MPTPRRSATQAGFTLVELIVASLVLAIGVLGAFTLLDTANKSISSNNGRVAASNLAREVTEYARGTDYDLLTPTQAEAALRSRARIAGTGATGAWKIDRRGQTYRLTPSICTFDDPKDGLSATPPPNPCMPAAAAVAGAPAEINPDDFRRLTLTLQWSDRSGTHRTTQTALIVNPSGGLGPRIINLPEPGAQITSDTVSWTAATNPVITNPADALTWTASDGVSQGALSGSSAASWAFDWNLGTLGTAPFVYDGSYLVSAQAFDSRGVPGETRSVTVHVNRRNPFAPGSLTAGKNLQSGGVVDLDWLRNKERDVVGYRVWRVNSLGFTRTQICNDSGLSYTVKTSCTDTSPGGVTLPAGIPDYEVAAVDYTDLKAGTGLRDGTKATINIASTSTRPVAPVVNVPTIVDGSPLLTWTAPAVGAGQRPIRLYRIYRDSGTSLTDRYDVTVDASTRWTDANPGPSTAHRYWVTAVDTSNNESNPSNAVDSP
ncbi:MAG: prepilin-type N-terminal cleavage/methylation domain-containing protein [Pseudolysinimonas sp.]